MQLYAKLSATIVEVNTASDTVEFSCNDSRFANQTGLLARTTATFIVPRSAVGILVAGTTPDGVTIEPTVELKSGKTGPLYLTKLGVTVTGRTAAGKDAVLRGTSLPPLADETRLVVKWPAAGAALFPHGKTELTPQPLDIPNTNFYVMGRVPKSGHQFTLDMTDKTLVADGQKLSWAGGTLPSLGLTAKGFKELGLAPSGEPVEFEPISVSIYGSITGGGHPSWIDLRNLVYAVSDQTIEWKHIGGAVTIDITNDGAQNFGVNLNAVKKALALLHQHPEVMHAFKMISGIANSSAIASDAQHPGWRTFNHDERKVLDLVRET